MALTREFKRSVAERIVGDPLFARALLEKAASLFLNGEPETARLTLRDVVNAAVGFERLAATTGKPAKSLHRMWSATGKQSTDNLAAIFGAVRRELSVAIRLRPIKAA